MKTINNTMNILLFAVAVFALAVIAFFPRPQACG
jgi:hypothetical protein